MFILALLLASSVGLVVYSLLPSARKREDQILRRVSGRRGAGSDGAGAHSARGREKASAAENLVRMAAPILSRPVMPKSQKDQSTLRIKLAGAGFRSDSAPVVFLASKTLLAAAMALLGPLMGVAGGYGAQKTVGLALFLGGMGFMLPNLWLWLSSKQRCENIRHGLPDVLDLMVISVEAGLGLDAAIQRVAKEMGPVHPALAEELTIATMETQMGVRRSEALENMAARTGTREVKSLVAVVNQAEKFGTSIAKTLRNQADAMRVKRRQAAEERAQKTAVKLMIPLILFIFPAIMIVLGGPAMLKLVRALGGMENSF